MDVMVLLLRGNFIDTLDDFRERCGAFVVRRRCQLQQSRRMGESRITAASAFGSLLTVGRLTAPACTAAPDVCPESRAP